MYSSTINAVMWVLETSQSNKTVKKQTQNNRSTVEIDLFFATETDFDLKLKLIRKKCIAEQQSTQDQFAKLEGLIDALRRPLQS